MSRTFTGHLTCDELAGAIAYAFAKSDRFDGEVPPSACRDAVDFLKKNNLRTGQVTPKIIQDLKKVNFDEENLEWEVGEGYSGTGSITGFHTLPNGLTILGVSAGGDWEMPLYFCLYFDGTQLRGYIPTDGNHWNTDTKTAYGSEGEAGVEDDEKASSDNVKKRFGVDSTEALGDMDPAAILADIQKRIVPAHGRVVTPMGWKDIDEAQFQADKAARERQEEENRKAWEARQSSMESVRVMTMKPAGQVPVPNDPIDGKSLKEILDAVMEEAQGFTSEVDRLRGMPLGPEAAAEAVMMRDGRLRKLVGTFCSAVELIRASSH